MSQQCKCDDCLLGITDILAEVALLNLKIQRTTCTSPKNGSEDQITGEDCGDNCCTNYPQNGGDDTDCNVLIRKVSKKRDRRIVYGDAVFRNDSDGESRNLDYNNASKFAVFNVIGENPSIFFFVFHFGYS